MASTGASRSEVVEIEPVEFCPTCPRRGDCQDVARLAIDTLMQASYFTVSPVPGDPEVFVSRVYVDGNGGRSDMFFDDNEALIGNCEGPDTVRKRRFRSDEVDCGAFLVTQRKLAAIHAGNEARWAEERATAVYLSPEETEGLAALPPEEFGRLHALSADELDELILFNREYPDEVEALRMLDLES